MTALENKILEALKTTKAKMEEYDKNRKAEYDEYMKKAEEQTIEYWKKDYIVDFWKKDYIHKAEWALHFQMHGYNFLTEWKNVISNAMYGRTYHEWHSAQAGRYKGTGHGAYATTELNEQEIEMVDKVFDNLVKRGYMKLSKSGKKATFTK